MSEPNTLGVSQSPFQVHLARGRVNSLFFLIMEVVSLAAEDLVGANSIQFANSAARCQRCCLIMCGASSFGNSTSRWAWNPVSVLRNWCRSGLAGAKHRSVDQIVQR